MDPHEPTVEITSLDPFGTQFSTSISITVRTRILRELRLPGLELLLSI
jgi:hypothetical protein